MLSKYSFLILALLFISIPCSAKNYKPWGEVGEIGTENSNLVEFSVIKGTDIIYGATYPASGASAHQGRIYRSTDGGETWTNLSGLTDAQGQQGILTLAAWKEGSTEYLIAGTYSTVESYCNLLYSSNAGSSFTVEETSLQADFASSEYLENGVALIGGTGGGVDAGEHCKTTDHGATWTCYEGIEYETDIDAFRWTDISQKYGTLYIATGPDDGKLLYATDLDAANDFADYTTVDPTTATTAWGAVEALDGEPGVAIGTISNEMWKTTDGGANWTEIEHGMNLTIVTDPNPAVDRIMALESCGLNIVLAGVENETTDPHTAELWISYDSGATWGFVTDFGSAAGGIMAIKQMDDGDVVVGTLLEAKVYRSASIGNSGRVKTGVMTGGF
jgi:hypothetical protein